MRKKRVRHYKNTYSSFYISLALVLVLVLLILSVTAVILFLPKENSTGIPGSIPVLSEIDEGEAPTDAAIYPASLLELLERNPETEEFVLAYPTDHKKKWEVDLSEYKNSKTVPLFLQWDKRWGYIEYGSDMAGLTGCGPVCLSMVAYYYIRSNDVAPDKMIEFAKNNGYCVKGKGSAWTLISEGAKKLGLGVEELPLDSSTIFNLLDKGIPIVCVMGPGVFTSTGHFIVLTGTKNGKITLNDPNSRKNSEKEWSLYEFKDQIKNLWAIRAC